MNATIQKPQITWDTAQSTFWWKMFCDASHGDNSPLGRTLYGFSKAQGHDERTDKEMLLMKKIQMIAVNGYVERCVKIEIYCKRGTVINKATDPLILTLQPKEYHFENVMLRAKYEEVRVYVAKLYYLLERGESIRYLLPKGKPEFSKDDWFKIENLFFTGWDHLDTYCIKLIKNGHPFERVTKFRDDYAAYKCWPKKTDHD